MNKELSMLNRRLELIRNRLKFLGEEQLELRSKAKSYPDCNDVPQPLRFEIFEHRLALNNYQKLIKELNNKIKKLEHWQSAESLKKERHGNITV